MEDNWKHINSFDITSDINTIHCDTRDFHCICYKQQLDVKDGKEREITKRFYDKAYQIHENEVLNWLKNIENMSGGEGTWRMLSFGSGWLKYIRMYRNPKDTNYFIICDSNKKPIVVNNCKEEFLGKDLLNKY